MQCNGKEFSCRSASLISAFCDALPRASQLGLISLIVQRVEVALAIDKGSRERVELDMPMNWAGGALKVSVVARIRAPDGMARIKAALTDGTLEVRAMVALTGPKGSPVVGTGAAWIAGPSVLAVMAAEADHVSVEIGPEPFDDVVDVDHLVDG